MHLPALHLPAVLLSIVYAAAIAVALTAPGEHTLPGLVVLAGLSARWALRHRHRVAIPTTDGTPVVDTVRAADVAA